MATFSETRAAVAAGVLALVFAATGVAAAEPQTPSETAEYEGSATATPLAPCCKYTRYYLWPSEPQTYECCATPPDRVVAPALVAPAPPESDPRGQVSVNEASPRIVRRTVEHGCVNLSELTPLERLLRSVRRSFGACVQFVVYDHFPCECNTECNDPTWFCDCPGVAPGDLPEIKPQDSLGSQPEFVSTMCFPCNSQSTCQGNPPPEPESPT